MTFEHDSVEQDIIDALRSEARVPVPPELRARVAGRLAMGAGITGLATSVAGATQAAASGVVAVAGASALGGGVGALTLLGLTKTLLVGMGLGAGAGLGLHVAFRPGAPVDAGTSVAAVAPVARAARGAQLAAGLPAQPRFESEAKGVEPVVPVAPSRGTRAVVVPPEARMNPVPELPHGGAPGAVKSLAEQQALLDEARAALRRGDGQAALAAWREHVARFPRTSFDEEREAVAIKALVLVGRRDEAREREAAFERLFPSSLLAPSLRAALGGVVANDSVTERAAKSQTPGRE